MSLGAGVSPRLKKEIEGLNSGQQRAILSERSGVVRAGPGSGKTRTLVARVAYLLETRLAKRRAVASITYTRQAAREIDERIMQLGVTDRRRVDCGTLHSWCLSAILRPYGPLLGMPIPSERGVVDDKDDVWIDTLQYAFDQLELPNAAKFERAAITKIRRELAAGYVSERTRMVDAAELFDACLAEQGLFDFDSMIASSLRIIKTYPRVGELLVSKYPWIVVDEYQDLGPVLHELVLTLRNQFGVEVTAFGDPDQSLMSFSGADPKYLNSLESEHGFTDLPLEVNYRCGSAIIAASHAALNETRSHTSDPQRQDAGVVECLPANGGLRVHADQAVEKLHSLITAGVPAHEIAIIYPGRGPMLDALIERLDASPHSYVYERDDRIPDSDLVDLVRAITARFIVGPLPISDPKSSINGRIMPTYRLANHLDDVHRSMALPILTRREAARMLADCLHWDTLTANSPLSDWIRHLEERLPLQEMARASQKAREVRALDDLRDAATSYSLRVEDIASGATRTGKVNLTTYHSAKGREWEVVILPGLIEGIFPRHRWHKPSRRFLEPIDIDLQQDRRSFYVGLTRARSAAIVVYGTFWETPWGARNELGVSRFALDVMRHISTPMSAS